MKGLLLGFALFLFACVLVQSAALAHEVRPAYLRIQQTGAEQFDVLWRVPARGDLRLGIYVRLPDSCSAPESPLTWQEAGTWVERWSATCEGGLVGHRVEITGLSSTVIDALARFERLDGTTQVVRLTPAEPGFEVSAAESWSQVAATYIALGIEHILLGIDHLLFVLALLMLVPNVRTLVWTVTSFTLAAATLGWVHVPQSPVEAVIALSILFVAMEIVHWRQGRPGITRRWPWLVARLRFRRRPHRDRLARACHPFGAAGFQPGSRGWPVGLHRRRVCRLDAAQAFALAGLGMAYPRVCHWLHGRLLDHPAHRRFRLRTG